MSQRLVVANDGTQEGKSFLDITNHPNLASSNSAKTVQSSAAFPSKLAFNEQVNALIGGLVKGNLETTLKTYTEFETRYYKSQTGVEASEWLLGQVQGIVSESGVAGATAEGYPHSEFDQASIIARIPGKSAKTVIVGAHLDSINGQDPTGRSPGAGKEPVSFKAIFNIARVE
jgi:bacterial leucyl aminopeptidase